jgi:hypothetical protein
VTLWEKVISCIVSTHCTLRFFILWHSLHRRIDPYIRNRQSNPGHTRLALKLPSRPRVGTNIVSCSSFSSLPAQWLYPFVVSSLASTVFQQYVASDNSSETFASLKRIHGLMPYFMLKAALKVSNPISMIRSVHFPPFPPLFSPASLSNLMLF